MCWLSPIEDHDTDCQGEFTHHLSNSSSYLNAEENNIYR